MISHINTEKQDGGVDVPSDSRDNTRPRKNNGSNSFRISVIP